MLRLVFALAHLKPKPISVKVLEIVVKVRERREHLISENPLISSIFKTLRNNFGVGSLVATRQMSSISSFD